MKKQLLHTVGLCSIGILFVLGIVLWSSLLKKNDDIYASMPEWAKPVEMSKVVNVKSLSQNVKTEKKKDIFKKKVNYKEVTESSSAYEDSNDEYLNYKDCEASEMTMAELSNSAIDWNIEYYEKVEADFQELLKLSTPKFQKLYEKEKRYWDGYLGAVHDIATFTSDSSSGSILYECDVINQGIRLREVSMKNMILYLRSKKDGVYLTGLPLSSKIFDDDMITEAYAAFSETANLFNEFNTEKLWKFRRLLSTEQACWAAWMICRTQISKEFPEDSEELYRYNDCTNILKRTKLLQLKNQNAALGIVSGQMLECSLPDDCSDEDLLNYPGFDKVWLRENGATEL